MIKFEKVNVNYVPQFSSLLDFSFSFNENYLLIGDKLSGANTILRLVSKFDKTYSGSIFINDKNIKQIKDKDLNLAFVSCEPYILHLKSLEENLGFGLKIRKINKNLIKKTVQNIIFQYDLQNFNKKMKELTLSQKKIICLLRAVIRKPKILLLEYFFENLDSEYVNLAMKILDDASKNSLILACENQEHDAFKDFNKLYLNYGVLQQN